MEWEQARAEYVTGRETYAQIAAKYGVSKGTIGKRATAEGWSKQRAAYRKSVVDRAIRQKGAKAADRLEKLITSADRLMGTMERITRDKEQFFRQYAEDIVTDEETGGKRVIPLEYLTRKADTRAFAQATKALNELTKAARNLYELPDRETRHRESIEKRKMALLERKEGAESVDGGGVIEIPAVLPEEPADAVEVTT